MLLGRLVKLINISTDIFLWKEIGLFTDTEFLKVRGLFRYIILYILDEEPLHGYAMIKKIRKIFGNSYSPSPGVLYPTLQFLEEMGLIRSFTKGRRKIYEITESGRKLLAEHRREVENFLTRINNLRKFAEETELVKIIDILRKIYENDIIVPNDVKEKIKYHVREIISLLDNLLSNR